MKLLFIFLSLFYAAACPAEIYVKCPDCEKYIEVTSGLELEPLLCEAKWRCMRCHRWNWALKPPYNCTNCGNPMGQP